MRIRGHIQHAVRRYHGGLDPALHLDLTGFGEQLFLLAVGENVNIAVLVAQVDLAARYGLNLTHFQRHYLPSGWEHRLHYHDTYGELQVYLVDVYDVFLSKLFSQRDKDRADLRLLLPSLERETIVRRLREHCAGLLAEERLRQAAEHNWYILTGETLPV